MQPNTFLPLLFAFFVLGFGLDRLSLTAWAKAHSRWNTALTLSAMAIPIAVLSYLGHNLDGFYIVLFGLAMGFRLGALLTARAKSRSENLSLTSIVEAALIEQTGAASVDITIDVSKFPREVLDDRIRALVKNGYNVTTTRQHNAQTASLQITGRANPPVEKKKRRLFN